MTGQLSRPLPVTERQALVTLAGLIRDRARVPLVLVRGDEVIAQPAGGAPPHVLALAGAAWASEEEQVETGDGRVAAAWPVRLRGRLVLVGAAEVTASEADVGRQLLVAVAAAVQAQVDGLDARGEAEALSEALTQNFEELTLLHNLGEVLTVTQSAPELLRRACRELVETVDAVGVAAYLPPGDEEPRRIVAVGALPIAKPELPALVERLLGDLGHERTVVINNHCADDPALEAMAPGVERVVLAPLPMGRRRRGALVAINRNGLEFGSPDAKLVRSVANSVGMFLENHRLYTDLQALMLELVRALVSSIDAKDPYTCGHSERVALLSRETARLLGLTDREVEWAYLAGLLHDIGKIGTPEAILQKPARLTDAEYDVIKRHPAVGYRILKGVKRLEPIRDAVRHHHERMDGTGYPDGLRGEEIPLLARITGLADAFDAMTSNRPYRPRLPMEKVRCEIERNVGRQFDARAADALLALDVERLMGQVTSQPAQVDADLVRA